MLPLRNHSDHPPRYELLAIMAQHKFSNPDLLDRLWNIIGGKYESSRGKTTRGEIDYQVVEVAPVDLGEELPDGPRDHGPPPDQRRLVLVEEPE